VGAAGDLTSPPQVCDRSVCDRPRSGGRRSEFQDQSLVVLFNDVASPFSFDTQYNFDVSDDDDLSTSTVAQNPALVDVQVYTVTDCSLPTSSNGDPSDEFFLFQPGAPKVDSITPTSGGQARLLEAREEGACHLPKPKAGRHLKHLAKVNATLSKCKKK